MALFKCLLCCSAGFLQLIPLGIKLRNTLKRIKCKQVVFQLALKKNEDDQQEMNVI